MSLQATEVVQDVNVHRTADRMFLTFVNSWTRFFGIASRVLTVCLSWALFAEGTPFARPSDCVHETYVTSGHRSGAGRPCSSNCGQSVLNLFDFTLSRLFGISCWVWSKVWLKSHGFCRPLRSGLEGLQ